MYVCVSVLKFSDIYIYIYIYLCAYLCNISPLYVQAVGYNSIEAEAWEVATSGEEMSKMESLLLDKNRKMEHELTQLKVWILPC
jgi:hypothetical protein